jgi:hypothetical protein
VLFSRSLVALSAPGRLRFLPELEEDVAGEFRVRFGGSML